MPFEIMFYVNCHHVTQSALIAPKSRNYRFVELIRTVALRWHARGDIVG